MAVNAFQRKLRTLLDKQKMSIPALARATNYARQYVWEIASGRKPPTVEAARAFDAALAAGGALADTVASSIPATEGGDMRRRTLLSGASAAAGMLLTSTTPGAANGSPLAALDEALFQPANLAPANMTDLREAFAAANTHFNQVRYRQLSHHLPGLVRTAEAARDTATHKARADIEKLLAAVYGLAAHLAIKLHEQGVAWAVVDRAVRAAHASGNPHTVAAAHRTAAVVLRRSGHQEQAQRLIVTAATSLKNDTNLTGEGDASLYATMLATAAYTAAIADRRDDAWTLADEAESALLSRPAAGFDLNDLTLYRSGIARALGDYGHAVDYARQVRVELFHTPERRARYWEDAALALMGRGRPALAWQALREAEAAAPQEVLYRPWAQQLTAALLQADVRGELPGLKEFAARVG